MIVVLDQILHYLAIPELVCLFVEVAVRKDFCACCFELVFVCCRQRFVCCRERRAGKNCLQLVFFSLLAPASFSGLRHILAAGPRWLKFGWVGLIWEWPLDGLVGPSEIEGWSWDVARPLADVLRLCNEEFGLEAVTLRVYGLGLEGPGRTGWGFWTDWWVTSADP